MGKNPREDLLASIVATIADYRLGEIEPPDVDHVQRWVSQFGEEVQEPILREMDFVLKKTYLSKHVVEQFLSGLLTDRRLGGSDPCAFWRDVGFLRIQLGGNSQLEILAMFAKVLQQKCGLRIEDCGGSPTTFLYLDDVIFSGNRVLNDIRSWLRDSAPEKSELYVVTVARHKGGSWYAKNEVEKAAPEVGKSIELNWWSLLEIEDRKANTDSADVLRPTSLPADQRTAEYLASLRYPPVLRAPGKLGPKKFFSSESGRHLLEQEFLQAGLEIRSLCPDLNTYQRPLGYSVLDTLGFGSLLVTFRNCPNNCPLALWVGQPWYPLFPRKIN